MLFLNLNKLKNIYLATRVLPEIDVEGDSYGFPGVPKIVESLVLMIEQLELEKKYTVVYEK